MSCYNKHNVATSVSFLLFVSLTFMQKSFCNVIFTYSSLSLNRCMNISGVNCVHSTRMIVSSTSLSAVGMGTTGE